MSVEQTNVRVMVRVRPFNTREISYTEGGIDAIRSVIVMEGNTVRLLDHEHNYQEREAFEFDTAFWSIPPSQNQFSTNPFVTQEDVFKQTGLPAVENALRGFHNTIFAYGQTGSGKTYTMLGSEADEGIAPRLVRALFEKIAETKTQHAFERVQFTLELSFLEIYNEKVKDLLAIAEKGKGRSNHADTGYAECRVRFHPEKGTFVEGLTRTQIESEDQCLTAIKGGMEHRAQTSTLMNDTSSRSHAIFQLCLTQKMPLKGTSRVSIINLVDLAGSERIGMSGVQGSALQEAKSINLSLSTLRRVIDILIENSRLRKGQRPAVPPYRESLLTWVLSDSLGGNSKTMMIAAVSPFYGNAEDTISTLRYALKAKAIVCSARVNEERTQAVVNSLRSEMEDLRKQLAAKADADEAERDRLAAELKQAEENFEKMQSEAKELDRLKTEYEEDLKRKQEELSEAHREMETLKDVEEERLKRAEELQQARMQRAEAEELLKRQEQERLRKEEELQQVKERKKQLQEHHDKAMEEEAKAKLLAEQARLRQCASAFHNAFILGKQKSGLEELKAEHQLLLDSVAELEQEKKDKEKTLTQLIADKGLYKRKMDLSQKRAAEIYEEVQSVLASREKRVAEVKEQRDKAHEELLATQQELRRYQEELQAERDAKEIEKAEMEREVVTLELQLERLLAACERHEQRKKQLQSQQTAAEQELKMIEAQHSEASKVLHALQSENNKKEAIMNDLLAQKEKLLAKREAANAKSQRYKADFDKDLDHLEALNNEVQQLKRQHAELRAYVDSKFFRLPQCSQIGGVQGYYSPNKATVGTFSTSPSKGRQGSVGSRK